MKPLSIILISCLGIFVYSNTFFCSFHFDDIPYIVDNPYIRDISNLQNTWNWWPCRFITFFSLALNYHFYQFNVFGYHLFNLAIHLVSSLLVWWLINLTFSTPIMKEKRISRHANLISLFTGLVFVSHPIQTQAITFIWQRAVSMAALFYLASLCFYVKSRLLNCQKAQLPRHRKLVSLRGALFTDEAIPQRSLQRICYIFSLITATLAMFTKENAITLPLMIMLYEFSFFKAKRIFNSKRLIPFLLIFLIIPLTWALCESEKFQARHSFFTNISPLQYLLTEFRVILTYIRLAFLPLHQNLDYDYSYSKSLFEAPTLFSFIFLVAVLLFAKRMFSKYRLISFSVFWFFLTLLPESSIFPFEDVIYEHRLYLPLAGYSIFLVSGIYYLYTEHSSLFGKNSIKAMTITLLMIVTCNSVLTYQRNKVWKDEFTLWSDIVQKSPHKARPYNSLGLIYKKQGNSAKALAYYNKAIEIFPNYAEAYNNRGLLYYKQDNFIAALSDYNKAIGINPDLVNAYNNRGLLHTKEGNFTQAILDFNQCIKLNPNFERAYVNRGIVWAQQGNSTQAISDLTKAIEINPNEPRLYEDRYYVYCKERDYGNAWNDVHKAQSLGDRHILYLDDLKKASGREN